MVVKNFEGDTFVAFLDISGFKQKMKKDEHDALNALNQFYKAGYDVIMDASHDVNGFFVSDCGILFASNKKDDDAGKLKKILEAVKSINLKMRYHDYMLTTSIAFGRFIYKKKIEFDGIEKNPFYGNAYVKAFLDNDKTEPKIQPGQCRIVTENFPVDYTKSGDFKFLKSPLRDTNHIYFYWSLDDCSKIDDIESQYNDIDDLKYKKLLEILKNEQLKQF